MADWNQALFTFIHSGSGRVFLLDDFAVFWAQYLPYLVAISFLVLACLRSSQRRRWAMFLEGALAVIISRGILTELVRYVFPISRPFEVLNFTALIAESGRSFPSGHAAFFFALGTVMFLVDRFWGYWFLGFAVTNGLARVFVGVHWPMDIVGGAALGILSALLVRKLLEPHLLQVHPVAQEAAGENP
ncbi:MAG: phosphatase PAP2 family protein [Candidatus Liptonbacteria bacterium]|nr:phosphatase PAP2 family protein [Candidatus Liptonbacteria bacterium]